MPLAAVQLGGQPMLERLEPLRLPQEVGLASDVRWSSEDELLLGVTGSGVYAWQLGAQNANLQATLAGTELARLGRPQDYSRVGGASSGGVAFAGLLFGAYLQGEVGIQRLHPAEFVLDLDRKGDLTVAVGLNRDHEGAWETRVAWFIRDGEPRPRGLLPSRGDSQGMERCALAELAVSRFISRDRIVIVPGAEQGVFVFDLEGELRDSLEASTFLADQECGLESGQNHLLIDPAYRAAWLSRRRVIDDVVADEVGNVFFFVRHVSNEIPLPSPSAAGPSIGIHGLPGGQRVVRGESAERFIWKLGASERESRSPMANGPDPSAGADPSGEPIRLSAAAAVELLRTATPSAPVSSESTWNAAPSGTRVCWDLVHAPVRNLRDVTIQKCAISSELIDQRLRADLRGARLVVLLRGGDLTSALRGGDGGLSQAFGSRLTAPRKEER